MRKRELLVGGTLLALSIAEKGQGMAAGETVDLAALQAKIPMAKVEEAMGSVWHSLSPPKANKIDIWKTVTASLSGSTLWEQSAVSKTIINASCGLRASP